MRKTIVSLALMALGSDVTFAVERSASGVAGLKEAVSGKTVYIQTPIGEEVAVRYRPNGTMVGGSSVQLAALAGESVARDKGRWWVSNEQLCQKWSSWSEGRQLCYKLRISGSHVQWSRNDGKSGTARLAN